MAATFVAERATAQHAAATTYNITVASITTGNLMVLVFALNGGSAGSLSSVTDNGTGSTWQIDVQFNASSTKNGIAIASAIAGATPPTSITVNLTSIKSAYKVLEFSGIKSTNWFDVGTTTNQSAGTAASVGAITPAAAGELIVAGFSTNSAQSTFTAGTNYTSTGVPNNLANPDVCAEYRLVGTTSETAAGTFAASVTATAYGAIASYVLPSTGLTYDQDKIRPHLQAVSRGACW